MDTPTIRLNEGETAVVGYGSLLSVQSIGKTLGREYNGPFVACHIEGWCRSWDVSMPNQAFYYEEDGVRIYPEKILYLNVRLEPRALMNCVVFVLNSDELGAMDHREWIYNRHVVTGSLRGVRVEGGDAIMYVAREKHIVRGAKRPRDAAVRASYLQIVEHSLQKVDPVFRAEYEHTTDPVPERLVIKDTLDQDRPNPWASAGHNYNPESQF